MDDTIPPCSLSLWFWNSHLCVESVSATERNHWCRPHITVAHVKAAYMRNTLACGGRLFGYGYPGGVICAESGAAGILDFGAPSNLERGNADVTTLERT